MAAPLVATGSGRGEVGADAEAGAGAGPGADAESERLHASAKTTAVTAHMKAVGRMRARYIEASRLGYVSFVMKEGLVHRGGADR